MADVTYTVEVRQRTWFERLRMSPKLYLQHFRIMRRQNTIAISAIAAWKLTGVLFRVNRGSWKALYALIAIALFSLAARSQAPEPTPVACPDGMVCISREAAVKSLETSDLAKAQAVQIVAQDKAIGDLKDIITSLKVDLAQMSGQKTQLEADRVADRAIMMVLLQNSKKKCLPFSVCLF